MNLDKIIRKYTLQNALKFNGKASQGAIIGKVLAENPDLKKDMKEISKIISSTIKDVNKLSLDKQKSELQNLAPELLEKKEKKERNIFEFLRIKENEKIVTAFPPEPSKYPHIGHAKAILLNYELAKTYNGKFILRFEDTNPGLAEKEFYDIHLENYKWLGIQYDKVEYASDYMNKFYEYAEKLINENKAYVCTCTQDLIKKSRATGLACNCRENKISFKDFLSSKEGEMIIRLKIDLKHKNSTMRDPTIMRIIDKEHPRTKSKFKAWPNYDFENSVMDGLQGITHRLRSKEFEMRNELQRYIQKILGFNETKIFEFARFNLEGVESSGRIIRDKIKEGKLLGWDDPSLTTLVALRRRGFTPEAIKNFVISTGISKAEAVLTWDDLIVHNKRILDSKCNRYFYLSKPVKIKIKNAPKQDVTLNLHPEFPERGERKFSTHEEFYLNEFDLDQIKENKLYRLMDCLNFIKKGNEFFYESREYSKYKNKGDKIFHWLPVQNDLIKVKILLQERCEIEGLAENLVKKLKINDIIQFERFGFVRLDKIEKDVFKFWFTH